MMHISIIFFVFIIFQFFSNELFCQTDSSKLNQWTPKAITGINVSQVSLTNWTQGGDNTFTWTLFGNFGLSYKGEMWSYRNTFKFAFGRTKLGSQDFRTNDNELFIESVISKNIGWAVDPFFSNTIRSPITTGFSYKTKTPIRIADFFDPGYITQSLGFTYDKVKGFKTRFGLAVQEVFTNRQRQFSDNLNSKDRLEAFKLETGIETVTSVELQIDTNILLKSSLRLFTRFESLKVWDVRWDNSIVAKVNNYLNANLSVLVVHEIKQSLRTQVKEALQLGLSYTIF
jgi:hypothetical protein